MKRFKSTDLLTTQLYLRDHGLLKEEPNGKYSIRGIVIDNIQAIAGISGPPDLDWSHINSQTGRKGSYDETTQEFETQGLITFYAMALEQIGKQSGNNQLLIIAYLIYEGYRLGLIETY